MFKLVSEPRWTWPVTVKEPNDEGTFDVRRFRARFRLIPEEERRTLSMQANGIREVLRRAVIEVLDVADENGAPVSMKDSSGLLDTMLSVAWIETGLAEAYAEALSGQPPKAASGN